MHTGGVFGAADPIEVICIYGDLISDSPFRGLSIHLCRSTSATVCYRSASTTVVLLVVLLTHPKRVKKMRHRLDNLSGHFCGHFSLVDTFPADTSEHSPAHV